MKSVGNGIIKEVFRSGYLVICRTEEDCIFVLFDLMMTERMRNVSYKLYLISNLVLWIVLPKVKPGTVSISLKVWIHADQGVMAASMPLTNDFS
jgi:hypothetical protein